MPRKRRADTDRSRSQSNGRQATSTSRANRTDDLFAMNSKTAVVTKIPDDKRTGYFICDLCILRLRDSYNFRNQVDKVQSKLNKKNYEDSTSLTDMLEKMRKIIKPSILTELDDESFNIVETLSPQENIVEQESSPEDEFLYCVEIKPLESEESKYVFEKETKKQNLLPKIKKETLRKIIIPAKQDDEPSNQDCSIDNVIINSKRDLKHAGKKKSIEEYKKIRCQQYANSIPYKLDKTDLFCKICNETFANNNNLVRHMPEHYPNLVCHICGKFAVNRVLLTTHLRTHNTEKKTCHICDKVMKKTSLRKHILMHTGDHFIYPCKKCPEKFSSFSSCINHMANVHQVEVQKHKCKVCPKTFRFSGALTRHVKRVHLQERNLPCPECGKLFFRKQEVQQHMVMHTKEKKFQCSLCLKSYGRASSLRQHMKIHNNKKQYKCAICERTFTQKCTLKGHMKIHEKSNIQQGL